MTVRTMILNTACYGRLVEDWRLQFQSKYGIANLLLTLFRKSTCCSGCEALAYCGGGHFNRCEALAYCGGGHFNRCKALAYCGEVTHGRARDGINLLIIAC